MTITFVYIEMKINKHKSGKVTLNCLKYTKEMLNLYVILHGHFLIIFQSFQAKRTKLSEKIFSSSGNAIL